MRTFLDLNYIYFCILPVPVEDFVVVVELLAYIHRKQQQQKTHTLPPENCTRLAPRRR